MTPTQRKAMEQALDALDSCDAAHPSDGGRQWYDSKAVDAAITALRAALAEQPAEQEPVAVVSVGKQPWNAGLSVVDLEQPLRVGTKLYTAPQPAIPPGCKLVPVEKLDEWRRCVNTLAILSSKANRYEAAIALKQSIRDAIDSPEAPHPRKRVPLTEEQIGEALAAASPDDAEPDGSWKLAQYELDIFRAAEAAHGITGEQN